MLIKIIVDAPVIMKIIFRIIQPYIFKYYFISGV